MGFKYDSLAILFCSRLDLGSKVCVPEAPPLTLAPVPTRPRLGNPSQRTQAIWVFVDRGCPNPQGQLPASSGSLHGTSDSKSRMFLTCRINKNSRMLFILLASNMANLRIKHLRIYNNKDAGQGLHYNIAWVFSWVLFLKCPH